VTRPGPCDVGYALCAVFAVRAALAFPAVSGNVAGRRRAMLDGAVVAGCALVLTWVLVLADPDGGRSSGFDLLLAYPLLDCVIITVLVVAVVRLPREHAVPLSLVVTGVLLVLLTNLVTFSLGRSGALRSPEPAEVGYLLGFALVGLGALLQSSSRSPAAQVTSLLQQLLPYAGVPPVVLVLLLLPERLSPGPIALMALLAVLLLARQVLAIAENDQLNARLLDRARRYQALVQGSADLTLVLDADGRVDDASPSALSLLGEVHGRHWADLLGDPGAARADLARCAGLAGGLATSARLRTGSGEVHLDVRLTDLSHRPEVGGVVVNARDVTDRWRTQRALAGQRAPLPADGRDRRGGAGGLRRRRRPAVRQPAAVRAAGAAPGGRHRPARAGRHAAAAGRPRPELMAEQGHAVATARARPTRWCSPGPTARDTCASPRPRSTTRTAPPTGRWRWSPTSPSRSSSSGGCSRTRSPTSSPDWATAGPWSRACRAATTAGRWRCSTSTSTTSRPSTTPPGTPPATSCSGRSPTGCGPCVRDDDLVVRLGGDEFAVVLGRRGRRAQRCRGGRAPAGGPGRAGAARRRRRAPGRQHRGGAEPGR
jgi:PAS domain S-box-containing protein